MSNLITHFVPADRAALHTIGLLNNSLRDTPDLTNVLLVPYQRNVVTYMQHFAATPALTIVTAGASRVVGMRTDLLIVALENLFDWSDRFQDYFLNTAYSTLTREGQAIIVYPVKSGDVYVSR